MNSWVTMEVPLLLGAVEEAMRVDDPATDEAVEGADPSDVVLGRDEESSG